MANSQQNVQDVHRLLLNADFNYKSATDLKSIRDGQFQFYTDYRLINIITNLKTTGYQLEQSSKTLGIKNLDLGRTEGNNKNKKN